MNANEKALAERILTMLEGQRFADFYNRDMDDYISGGVNPPSKEEILEKIHKLLPKPKAKNVTRKNAVETIPPDAYLEGIMRRVEE